MRAQTAVTTGRWVRLLLLFCTLLGLAAMHTLGHGAHAGGHVAAHPASTHAAAAPVTEVAGVVADCPGDDCRHAAALPLGNLGGDRSGWVVCLAVLGAFAVALLIAVFLRGSRVARSAVARVPGLLAGSRSPPPASFGLRLATASVLRR